MVQNILYMLIGASFGVLVLGIIEANFRVMYIRKISALKINNSRIMEKNKRLFDELQETQLQVELLQSYIINDVEDAPLDIPSKDW